MVAEMLTRAGIKNRQNHFVRPPRETYAVWADILSTDGADGMPPELFTHDVTIQLFEYELDPEAEAALEAEMDAAGLHWMKQYSGWSEIEQTHQVTYDFTYVTKQRRI